MLVVMMCRELVSGTRNIGTTLFEPADLIKDCWGQDTIALLTDRIVADDLLPVDDKVPRICSEYVLSLMEYIFVTLETVRNTMTGYRMHSMSLACADVFGGFIYSEVLPRARMEYYAGKLPYEDMCTLYDVLSRFQTLLRKQSRYWKPPYVVSQYPSAAPIQIPSKCENECSKLITYPKSNSSSFVIPLPFVDDKFQPSTVAVPYKHGSLYKLEAPYSAMIIAKYYVTSMKCLKEKSCAPDEVNGFCEYFYVWLVKDVVPLLANEPWYMAFGGVLRILESMKQMGIATFSNGKFLLPEHKTKYNKPGNINIDHYNPSPLPPHPPPPENEQGTTNGSNTIGQSPDDSSFLFYGVHVDHEMVIIVIVAVGTAVTMWLLMLLLLLCCKCSKCCKSKNGGGAFYNVFVSFFYMIRDTLNAASSIKTAEDVERPRPQTQKQNFSPASSAGKMAKASSKTSSNTGAPSSGRPFNPYEDQILEAQDEDESLTETTTDTEDEYFRGNNSLRKVTSS